MAPPDTLAPERTRRYTPAGVDETLSEVGRLLDEGLEAEAAVKLDEAAAMMGVVELRQTVRGGDEDFSLYREAIYHFATLSGNQKAERDFRPPNRFG